MQMCMYIIKKLRKDRYLTFSGVSIPLHVPPALALAHIAMHGQVGVADQVHVHLLARLRGLAGHERVEVLGPGRHPPGHGRVHTLTIPPGGSSVTLTESPLTMSVHGTSISADVPEHIIIHQFRSISSKYLRVVVVVVVAPVVAVHHGVVHVHHHHVHVVPVVHTVHGHGPHGAQGHASQEPSANSEPKSLARVTLGVSTSSSCEVGSPPCPIAWSSVAILLTLE